MSCKVRQGTHEDVVYLFLNINLIRQTEAKHDRAVFLRTAIV